MTLSTRADFGDLAESVSNRLQTLCLHEFPGHLCFTARAARSPLKSGGERVTSCIDLGRSASHVEAEGLIDESHQPLRHRSVVDEKSHLSPHSRPEQHAISHALVVDKVHFNNRLVGGSGK